MRFTRTITSHPTVHRTARKAKRSNRRGATLVLCALLFIPLVGMVGLVIDAGLLMAAHRNSQNAADAAALAAAEDLMVGKASGEAGMTAQEFVAKHASGDEPLNAEVHIPPATGPYAGENGYAEVVVSGSRRTYFLHVLSGLAGAKSEHSVQARAVAGTRPVTAGAGVVVLDRHKKPGLDVGGGAQLLVNGRVYDNSEGGGVDENGDPVLIDTAQYAGTVSPNALLRATDIRIVGGVNDPDQFQNFDPNDSTNVLHAGQLPVPDPLINLATPTVDTGVDPTYRGSPQASNTNLKLGDQTAEEPKLNYIENEGTEDARMVLHPGIYTSIDITGGKVRFEPGIYVLRPDKNTTNTLKITGGDVVAEGIMFYNTGSNYDPVSGAPDSNDRIPAADGLDQEPPATDGADFGGITINASMQFSPIDLDEHSYDPMHTPSEDFEGMLFYQRRLNTEGVDFQGNAEEGNLTGTIYAKWAHFKIAGQGTFDAQFIVGSLEVTGNGELTINYTGEDEGHGYNVFLVE